MTDSYWWDDPDLTSHARAAVTFDPETPPIDVSGLSELIALWLSEIPDGTGAIAALPEGVLTTADLPPGFTPPGGYVYDSASGVVTDVTPDDSGIAPLLPAPSGKGSIVNPAWVQHKFEQSQHSARTAINYVPPPDKITIFTGAGQGPTWADVWAWTTAEQRAHMTFLFDGQTINGAELQAVADIVAASVTKGLGGMISNNLLASLNVDLLLSRRIDTLQGVTYGAVANLNADAQRALATVDYLTKVVIPNLQAQITQLRTSIPLQIEQAIQANNIRIRDAWITPLRQDVAAERDARILADQQTRDSIPDRIRQLAPELLAPALAGIAALGTRVATLEQEAEQCTKPMCQVLGPNSPLGKLLQAIKWAALLALFAELGALTADDINGLVAQFGADLVKTVTVFDDMFVGSGATIAHSIASAIL